MRFTLSWLREHLDFTASLDEIVTRLNAIGLEVESVDNPADRLKGFRVAKILEAHRHPDADRLQVCIVAAGGDFERVQVVCGAPNARAGLHVIFAPPGTYIPGSDMTIKAGRIRGQESGGMLCSLRELGLGEEADGIAELPENVVLGQSYAAFAKLDDPIVEIAITPNRGDALSIRGIARDLAAAGVGHLKPWLTETVEGSFPSPINWAIDYDKACPHVVGCMVRGVRNGPSPAWLRRRLEAVGVKPISRLVDVTNYLTYDLGRPLHVFDAAKLAGDTLTVTRAARETFTGLDGRDYVLGTDDIVIVDNSGVQSLAGIMGGEASGVSDETTDVFIESALFDAVQVALTGRRLAIHTDARQRFERGIDPALLLPGLEAAIKMILDLCGGEASEIVQAGETPSWQRDAWLRFERIETLGGVQIDPETAVRSLEHLGFAVLERTDEKARFAVPSWRNDIATGVVLDQAPHLDPDRAQSASAEVHAIEAECDLLEEILRLHGLDAIPARKLPRSTMIPSAALDARQARKGIARRVCATRGLMETVGFSFVALDDAARFGGAPESLRLLNPIASDLNQLRPTPLPNLVHAWQENAARGHEAAGFFELGPAFGQEGQALVLAGLRGGRTARHPEVAARDMTVWDAKGDLEAALLALGVPVEALSVTTDAAAHYHPGRSGQIRQGPKIVLGAFGELHPRIAHDMGIDGTLVAFELFMDAVPLPKNRRRAAPQLSPMQPVRRDFAFLAGPETEAQAVLRAARGAERNLITEVRLFDVYEGKPLEPGYRSLGIEVVLQPMQASLMDAEIEAVSDKIVAAVEKATGATLRR
ncbi:phenylalanyl-tRNA synthetase subunit beta [Neoasaia chiangmaiensis NBRC 101099]|uniref:Phenylalanine--tRNA ligase beta subunit n=1 Tax=Neoasaia chiangmaiensis TaxID=320497 RepID=A0A1U9KN08_9PROT|nr:phenylalanine--tRNA ligase subunit beta [Neoasaia chiangmaiensis]AQS87179.1 phenylalanine--tRNA ligase subunit beta [Neoasaia chiangmaiensis]GBR38244.1 phenylalanyl-tRNA synthetase subunit beta [Neoasaia chiangmaiensis NBRC 101099]GEN15974.1 phenylalanine--tRNA ligase beta subunit [Neoasaia chiangmaiensis]